MRGGGGIDTSSSPKRAARTCAIACCCSGDGPSPSRPQPQKRRGRTVTAPLFELGGEADVAVLDAVEDDVDAPAAHHPLEPMVAVLALEHARADELPDHVGARD